MSEPNKFYDKDGFQIEERSSSIDMRSYMREDPQNPGEEDNGAQNETPAEGVSFEEDPSPVEAPKDSSVTGIPTKEGGILETVSMEADKEEPKQTPEDPRKLEETGKRQGSEESPKIPPKADCRDQDNLSESSYQEDSSRPHTLRSDAQLLLQELAFPAALNPLPLGKPISLQVGSFDNILNQLKISSNPSLAESTTIKIRLSDMLKNMERGTTEPERLDKLWAESLGPERTNLAENLLRMFRQNVKPSLLVVVENRQFRCHAIILQLVSTFFRRAPMGKSHVYHLPSSMVNARAFVAMYRWALEPVHEMSTNYLLQVLRAAQFFDCPEIVADIWNAMELVTRDPEKAVSLYQRGITLGLHLEDHLIGRMANIFLQFAASQEFRLLEAGPLKRLLSMGSLAVNSEMEVYMAAVVWLDHKWPERQCHATEIIKCVRFEQMPFLFLFSLVRRTDGPPVLRFLAGLPEIRKRALLTLEEM